jgi:peptidoglycan-associated lipoprotein
MMRGKLTTALLLTIVSALVFSAITLASCICSTLSVIAIDPNVGFNIGAINTKITGKGFDPKAIVRLTRAGQPDIVGTNVKVNSPTEIAAAFDLKGKQLGKWNVVVENPNKKIATLVDGFTIENPPPTVTAIFPNTGLDDEQISAVVPGTYFQKGAAVKLVKAGSPEINGTNVAVVSATNLSADFDLRGKALGVYDVVVTNPDGKSGTLKNGFTLGKMVPEPTLAPSQALKPIFFDLDKSNIKKDQETTLANDLGYLKDYLAKNPKAYVILGAHCDERGSVVYNTTLSTNRGEAIQKYLVSNGIDPNRIIVYSYGKDYPAKPGHDEAAWAFNRRVDVSVWETKPSQSEALKTQ